MRINRDAAYADGDGALDLALEDGTESLLVEWAPSDTPEHPMLPFRITYHLDFANAWKMG